MIDKIWEVNISVNCENILSIGYNHVSGSADVDKYEDTIKHIIDHLKGFIGYHD